MEKYKKKLWDGKLRLFKMLPNGDGEFNFGLMKQLEVFCSDRDYPLIKNYTENFDVVTKEDLGSFVTELDIHSSGKKIDVRDYQFNCVLDFLNTKRMVALSPTSCLDPETVIEVDLNEEVMNVLIEYRKSSHVKKNGITLNELKYLTDLGFRPKINTPSGFEEITDTYRKNGLGVEIYFENESIPLKAANNHLLWYNDEWTEVINLNVGNCINGKTISKIINVEPQDWIDFTIDAEHESYYHNGILHHNSGKSLILYIIIRYLLEHKKSKTLLIVPNTSLCHQLSSDFRDYSSSNKWDVEGNVHLVFSGKDKDSDKPIILSTWQSLQSNSMKKGNGLSKSTALTYFKQFDLVLCDECHLANSVEITSIIDKCINAEYRIGVTGTLNGQKTHSLQLESLFGPIKKVISTKELMDNNQVSALAIKCIVLKYPEEVTNLTKKLKYQEELDFLITCKERNTFIKNLSLSIKGNTLILYQFVEKHGDVLYEIISNSKFAKDKVIYYINGSIQAEQREVIRKAMETQDNVILIGSVGTVATGTNIKNLHNIIFASPAKSRIRNLQSIGRILRKNDNKSIATLYDISDDLRYKNHQNYTLLHFKERIKIYNEEKFNYKLINTNLKISI